MCQKLSNLVQICQSSDKNKPNHFLAHNVVMVVCVVVVCSSNASVCCSRESTGTSTSDWDDDSMLTIVTSAVTSLSAGVAPGNPRGALVTSLSSDNLQQELARATYASDGLSDKENVVEQMKHHVKYLPDNLTTVRCCSYSSFCYGVNVTSNDASVCY